MLEVKIGGVLQFQRLCIGNGHRDCTRRGHKLAFEKTYTRGKGERLAGGGSPCQPAPYRLATATKTTDIARFLHTPIIVVMGSNHTVTPRDKPAERGVVCYLGGAGIDGSVSVYNLA